MLLRRLYVCVCVCVCVCVVTNVFDAADAGLIQPPSVKSDQAPVGLIREMT